MIAHVWSDYTLLSTLVPAGGSEAKQYAKALRNLQPRLDEAQKRETGEMVDKLKGLGNSILGE